MSSSRKVSRKGSKKSRRGSKKSKRSRRKSKRSNHSDSDRAVIFVFYAMPNKDWTYKNNFPKGWTWTGSGATSKKNYPREEQFNGPRENQVYMIKILDDFFKDLKNNGVIVRYKIRNSYKP